VAEPFSAEVLRTLFATNLYVGTDGCCVYFVGFMSATGFVRMLNEQNEFMELLPVGPIYSHAKSNDSRPVCFSDVIIRKEKASVDIMRYLPMLLREFVSEKMFFNVSAVDLLKKERFSFVYLSCIRPPTTLLIPPYDLFVMCSIDAFSPNCCQSCLALKNNKSGKIWRCHCFD